MIPYVSETSFRNNIKTIDMTAIDDKIRDKKKNFNMILTEKQQTHQPDHQIKLINMIM